MTDLTETQEAKRASIQKSAMITGGIVGAIAGLIALWVLSSQGAALRYGGAAAVTALVLVLVQRAMFNSGAKSAKCASCGAAFSRSRTDRTEALHGAEPKEERKNGEAGTIEVTTWTEETYDVTETYACAKCGNEEKKAYTVTRRKDEQTRTERPKKSADAAAEVAETVEVAEAEPELETESAGSSGRKGASRGRKSQG